MTASTTPGSGTSACAVMFGAVAYLAVRQARFEERMKRERNEWSGHLVKEIEKWAKDTSTAIEEAMRA